MMGERHVPEKHLLRAIDRFVDLSGVRGHLAPFYSETGRPSIDPELLIRMLIVGYCFGIRSERRLCEEVHLNLGYRCASGRAGTQDQQPWARQVGVWSNPVTSINRDRGRRTMARTPLVQVQNFAIVTLAKRSRIGSGRATVW